MEIVYLYALLCPISLGPRYLGISVNPKSRYSVHLSTARHNGQTRRDRWIKGLLDRDMKPFLHVIEKIQGRDKAYQIEQSMIASHREIWNMTNLTDGGPGVKCLSEKEIERRRKCMMGKNNPSYGGLSEEHKERIRKTAKANLSDPSIRRKRSIQAKNANRDLSGRFAKEKEVT